MTSVYFSCLSGASAESRNLFDNGKRRFIGAAKVSTDAFSQQLSREQTIRFHNSLLRMHPLRLDRIEPGTFRRQKERQNAHAFALLLDLTVVRTNPGSDHLAHVPGGVIPDQQPGGLALRLQASATPLQKLSRDGADWTTSDEAKRHLLADRLSNWSLLPQHPITGERFGVRITLLPALFHQAHRLILILPSRQAWKRKPTPPHFVQKPDRPAGLRACPGHQPIACVFFCWYCRSGLVIQCLARFQLFPKRLRARRTLSPETSLEVSPCPKLICAARAKVHTLVSRPKSRGLRCKRSCSASNASSGKVVRSRWGREEPSCNTASPWALKPWMMLSAVCLWQPTWSAIAGARWPRADANNTWLRRKTKASFERKPAWMWPRSFSVKGRM